MLIFIQLLNNVFGVVIPWKIGKVKEYCKICELPLKIITANCCSGCQGSSHTDKIVVSTHISFSPWFINIYSELTEKKKDLFDHNENNVKHIIKPVNSNITFQSFRKKHFLKMWYCASSMNSLYLPPFLVLLSPSPAEFQQCLETLHASRAGPNQSK